MTGCLWINSGSFALELGPSSGVGHRSQEKDYVICGYVRASVLGRNGELSSFLTESTFINLIKEYKQLSSSSFEPVSLG
jgi:hypothetical protein